ncbi:MAG TPA: RNA-binding protein [Acidobacteriota bacterium]|nr:RNA-binding protein [Acidobacteriota bacterium]
MPGKLFIGNLSFNITEEALSSLLADMNIPASEIRLMRDHDTGRSRGFAFAELSPEADMDSAIALLNGKIIDGRPLTVNEARQQKPRNPHGGEGRFDRPRNRFGKRNGPRGGSRDYPPRNQ